jgi:hypothetical protein
VAKTFGQRWRDNWVPTVGMMLSIVLSGCVQSSGPSSQLAQPGPAAPATSDPLVLSGVAHTQGDAVTQASRSPPPPPNADIVAVPPGGAPEPVVSSTPLPPTDAALAMPPVTPSEPAAQAPGPAPPSAAPVTTADGYPNINIAPKRPQSQLLTPEERAKLIEELNALAGRPGAGQ